MAPPFFDPNNFWAFHGATLLASGGGVIASYADIQESFVEIAFGGGAGQLCAAMAVAGEPTDPQAGFGPRTPTAYIVGGYRAEGYFFPTVGNGHKGGMNTSHSFYSQTETVNLIEVYPDVPLENEKPPYPPTMTTVLAGLGWPGGGSWADGRPVWTGEYWIEIYSYLRANDPSTVATPGNGDTDNDPVTCPPRPPWPYREPIATVDGGGPARIRRSRP